MFNVFKKILKNEQLTQDEYDKISSYVMCRWMAGNPGTLPLAQFINMYHKIPLEAQVKLLQTVINKKIKYIPYIKGSKFEDKDLDYISRYYNISLEKAVMYSEFISTEDLNEIKKLLDTKEGIKK